VVQAAIVNPAVTVTMKLRSDVADVMTSFFRHPIA
jgi:hypothetical protein